MVLVGVGPHPSTCCQISPAAVAIVSSTKSGERCYKRIRLEIFPNVKIHVDDEIRSETKNAACSKESKGRAVSVISRTFGEALKKGILLAFKMGILTKVCQHYRKKKRL